MKPLMSCKEAAAFLGISLGSIWEKCRNEEIPHIRISRRCYRIRPADLEAYVNKKSYFTEGNDQ